MGPIDLKRLAAIDMHGLNGRPIRRKIITAEFVLGATLGVAFGLKVLVSSANIWWTLFGAWLTGGCLNYIPLAVHALLFFRQGLLKKELEGVDISSELRFYTKAQFWIAVPLLFVVISIPQAFGRRPIS